MEIGQIVKYQGGEYIFLGPVEPKENIGWFAPFPIKPLHPGYESEIQVFAWIIKFLEPKTESI